MGEVIREKIKRKNKIKKTPGQRVLYTIVFIILLTFSLSYVLAMLWGFIAGLNTNDGIILKPFAFPRKPMWHN